MTFLTLNSKYAIKIYRDVLEWMHLLYQTKTLNRLFKLSPQNYGIRDNQRFMPPMVFNHSFVWSIKLVLYTSSPSKMDGVNYAYSLDLLAQPRWLSRLRPFLKIENWVENTSSELSLFSRYITFWRNAPSMLIKLGRKVILYQTNPEGLSIT